VASVAPAEGKPFLAVENKGLLTLAIMGAAIIQILDSTIANVAIPHMQSSLGAT
jgi:DHA2 family multidrug resistance protein